MNGIEILTSNEVAVAYEKFNWSAFWITIAIVAFGALIVGLIAGFNNQDGVIGVLAFSMTLIVGGFMFGPAIGSNTSNPIEYETQYKITIDDSVSMTEFLDKYEIIDQDGKIYTVRERE